MIETAKNNSYSFLAKVLQDLKDGNPVGINDTDPSRIHDGVTALHEAAELGDVDILQGFLDSGADVNVKLKLNLETPLHRAFRLNKLAVVEALLNVQWIDTSSKNDNGQTPLHIAVIICNLETIKTLLRANGIDKNVKNDYHRTPSEEAEFQKNLNLSPRMKARYQLIMDALAEEDPGISL